MNARQLIALIIAALMLLGLIIPATMAFAAVGFPPVSDNAGILTANELDRLNRKAQEFIGGHNLQIIILTTADPAIQDTSQHADDFYTLSAGETDGVMLYINMHSRDVLFLTFGSCEAVFKNYIGYTLDIITPMLSNGDYYGAAFEFIGIADTILTMGPDNIAEYYYDSDVDFLEILGGSIFAGLFAGGLVLLILVLMHGRSMPPAPSYHTYLGGKILTRREVDRFVTTHTSRVAIPKPTSSGGGGGGRSGGGMARGGGGRKF
ncbi:MAG: TPM domain-containing protein [Oscillospiraceae bacterium]|nr:TPM domain-containing protein [Oscillospiraceae bacterium]